MNEVISGFCLVNTKTGKTITDVDISKVYLREITDKEINDYVQTGEPLDKAGAYAIQGGAEAFIEHFEGDRHSIMGFPLAKILSALGNT
jgi:septum formation protein